MSIPEIVINPGPLTAELRSTSRGHHWFFSNRPLRLTLGFLALVVIRGAAWVVFALPGPVAPGAVLGAAGLLGAGVIAWAILGKRTTVRAWLAFVVVMCGFLASLASLGQLPIVRYQALYAAIATGMTTAEVRALIDHHFPDKKPVCNLVETGAIYMQLDPDDPRYNAEIIGIHMVAGRVASKEYLPD